MIHQERSGRRVMSASQAGSNDDEMGPRTERRDAGTYSKGDPSDEKHNPAEIPKQTPNPNANLPEFPSRFHSPDGTLSASAQPGELQILQAIAIFKAYLQQERNQYRPLGSPLRTEWVGVLRQFFSPKLLAEVRILELKEKRVPNPSFYGQARSLGFTNLPDISHQASVTFLDVVVFHEKVEERTLFHGLVHVLQVQVLGIDRYAQLFVRGFLKRRSYFMVPLKAHAFALDLRFVVERAKPFSVEEEIQHWARVGLY